MISLNSSPYVIGKPEKRIKMLSEVCKDSFGLIYCNQYGAQDQLLFDGHSFLMDKNGSLQAYLKNDLIPTQNDLAKGAKGQYVTVDTTYNGFVSRSEEDHELKMILLGLYDYVKKSGFSQVCFGSSGGIDSSLICAVSAMIFGGGNVHCIMMPSIYSSEGSVADAKKLHKNFGVNEYLVPIEHVSKIEHMNKHLGLTNYNTVADENYQARLRTTVSLHFSNATGALALNTSNKTELCCGYFTLGEIASFDVIGDLYKKQVYQFARRINQIYGKEMIGNAIIDKKASAELKPGQFDEDSLLPYEILDEICRVYIEEYICDLSMFKDFMIKEGNEHLIVKYEKILEEKYYKIVNLIDKMEFKRRLSPLCPKISKKAFGIGRLIPILKG
jgi:NAD+ synthetase